MTKAENKLYRNEQLQILSNYNIWFSGVGLALYVLMIFTDSHLTTLGFNPLLNVRLINALICAVVLMLTVLLKDKVFYTQPLAVLLIGSTLFGMAYIMQLTDDYTVSAVSWSMLIVLFVGFYPLQLVYTLTLIAAGLAYLGFNFLFSVKDAITRYEFLTLFYNTIIALVFALVFSRITARHRKKEFLLKCSLEKANEDLKVLDRAKNNFFANISHELRTPLTLIHAPVESILQNEKVTVDQKFFKTIYNNTTRLLHLITTLLDFSRLENGRLMLDKKVYNLSSLVQYLSSSFSSAMDNKSIEYAIEVEPDVFALFDAPYIEKAFINLLSNAVKFTPEKGKISVLLSKEGGTASLTVQDTGPGIPQDKVETIFERFTQLDDSTSRKYSGSGIGLSFAKEIIEMHGGRIQVFSETGNGSTFTMSFPVGDIECGKVCDWHSLEVPLLIAEGKVESRSKTFNVQQEEKTEAVSNNGSTPIILLVEDNLQMREMISSFLKDEYVLESATNGREGLELLQNMPTLPDIILSDVMMPEMDGYEFTRMVHSNLDFKHIPILLLTAKSETRDSLSGFESGAIDYIIKPFNIRELKARIKAQLEMKSLHDKLRIKNEKLLARLREKVESVQPSHDLEEKISALVEFIDDNYLDSELDRGRLADTIGVSEGYLSSAFKKMTGFTIPAYINSLRIEKAKELLRATDKTITDIVYYCGFDSLRHFNRQFKKETGSSPSEYRSSGERGE